MRKIEKRGLTRRCPNGPAGVPPLGNSARVVGIAIWCAGYRYGGADMARGPHTHNNEGTTQCVVSRLTRSVCVSPMLVQPLTKVPVDKARVEE